MSYDANVLRRATQRLEEERRARSDRAARLRQEAYEKEPRLAQLDKKLQGTMSQLMAAALRRGESTAQAICWGPSACPRTPWTTSPPAPCAGTRAGVGRRCASA